MQRLKVTKIAAEPFRIGPLRPGSEVGGVGSIRTVRAYAGSTGEPWLGPDILDKLEALAAEGKRAVLSVPFGFVCDHLEILYDVDIECQQKARELGVELRRIRLPNDDPEFIELLAALVTEAQAGR